MGILSAAEFSVRSTVHKLKGYTPVQLLFDGDIIILIKHTANQKLIHQHKQEHINYDNVHKYTIRVDHTYQAGDKFMLRDNTAQKHENLYNGPYIIFQ